MRLTLRIYRGVLERFDPGKADAESRSWIRDILGVYLSLLILKMTRGDCLKGMYMA